ncbi:MAG TPA: glycosyltransferase [Chloroflexota bacterium]|nr:glycosyltransferase [Chloroflexota bacterium]
MASSSRPLRIAVFCHSIVSDWNHGNAHFLRGLIRNLQQMGHTVVTLEEENNWSISNLVHDHGQTPLEEFNRRFPFINHRTYSLDGRQPTGWLTELLQQVDVCLVHEWNPDPLVKEIGKIAAGLGKVSLFHDTHYRALTEPDRAARLGLETYSAILAFGPTIADIYRNTVTGPEVVVFHEGADTDLFHPLPMAKSCDVVFVGNWGDDDRSHTTRQFFIDQSRALPDLSFSLFGVRYPDEVLAELHDTGIDFGGWLPNYLAPEMYATSRITVHIPRKEYLELVKGTPTIRVFEALACGVPLISAGWRDDTGLFQTGKDFIVVDSPVQMTEAIHWLASDDDAREKVGNQGRATVLARHSCRHRAQELVDVVERIRCA